MKVYIKSATNISDLQAKIAKKQAEIDKKLAWIAKKEESIQKKLAVLSGKLTPEEFSQLTKYLDALKTTNSYKIPVEDQFDCWGTARKYGWDYDSKEGKILYSIDNEAESIYNSNYAIKEATAVKEKYQAQLAAIKQKDKEIDEIPEILKEFMNQLVDAWDKFDEDIRDRSPEFYAECRAKMDEMVPRNLYSKERRDRLFELYPEFARRYDQADNFNKYSVDRAVREHFENEYLNTPFHREFGVSVETAKDLWGKSDDEIHAANLKEGKRVILDLVKRVTKITGPITDWANLHSTAGNGGWTVLNGYVVGEDGTARVETILAGGYAVQRLHARTLVKEIK